jgi:4-hydroxy-tetrahydrodipicolinate synthase
MSINKTIFQGAATALITPFKDGAVDYNALENMLEFQINGGIDALVICGTTGEPATLDDDEHKRVLEFAIEKVNHRVPVIAGTGSNNTQYAIELSRFAEKAGADGLLLVTPYYNKCSQKGIVSHFNTVADSVNIPCIVYNVPGRTGFCISLDSYKQIAKHENIVATNEASGNLLLMMEVLEACGNDINMYSGDDQQIVPLMSMGAIGVISVFSNICPHEMHEITRAWFEGRAEESRRLFFHWLDLMNALFFDVNPIPVKAAMQQIGYSCGGCRLPLTDMPEPTLTMLIDVLKKHQLI